MTNPFGDKPIGTTSTANPFGDAPLDPSVVPENVSVPEQTTVNAVSPIITRSPRAVSEGQLVAQQPYELGPKTQQGLQELTAGGRTVAQGLLGAGGAVAGTALGPYGTAVGAGLGYAIANELTDLAEQSLGLKESEPLVTNLKESAYDVVRGGAEEVVGGAVTRAIRPLFLKAKDAISKFPISSKAAYRQARDAYAAFTDGAPIYSATIDEGKALEQAIPGLKFSRGQLTQDVNTLKFEMGMEDSELLRDALKEQNTKAILDHLDRAKGSTTLGDTVEEVNKRAGNIDRRLAEAEGKRSKELLKLDKGHDSVIAGMDVVNAVEEGHRAARREAGERFANVMNESVPVEGLKRRLKSVLKATSRVEPKKNFPAIAKSLEALLNREGDDAVTSMTAMELQSIRSEMLNEIRQMKSTPKLNRIKLRRSYQFVDAIDSALDEYAEKASPALKEAREFFKATVIDKYERGVAGDIMGVSRKADVAASASKVMDKLFRPGVDGGYVAKDAKALVADNMESVVDFIDQKLYNALNTHTGDINERALFKFVQKYGPALKEYGLTGRYSNLQSAQQAVDKAMLKKKAFEKTEASKLLKVDVNAAVDKAIKTGYVKNSIEDLLAVIGTNKKAKEGLQNAVIDDLVSKLSSTSDPSVIDLRKLNKVMGQKDSVLKSWLFSGAEGARKLEALDTVHKALNRLSPEKAKSVLAGDKGALKSFLQNYTASLRLTGSRAASYVTSMLSMFGQYNNEEVKALLNRTVVDPDFALTLKLAATQSKDAVRVADKRLKTSLVGMGLRTADSLLTREEN